MIILLQQSTFRRFAAKYYHLFLLKQVSVDICCFRGVILSTYNVVKLTWKFLTLIDIKKLRFRHKLTANDTSKTAKITKRSYYSAAHWHSGDALVGNHLLEIFTVLDVSFAINLCLNHSLLHLLIIIFFSYACHQP